MATAKYEYKPYEESEAVQNAQQALQEHQAAKPGAYESQYGSQLNDIMDKIQNREKFSYDLNGDALYNQYKNQYIHNGRLAMQDTLGQASALTGGYGNSYAQQAGQQTYQGYLNQLNDRVPELYRLAMDQYDREGDDLYRKYSMLGDRENQDYSRWQDTTNLYYSDLDRLQNAYDTERNWDRGNYDRDQSFNRNMYEDDRNFEWNKQQTEMALAQTQMQWYLDNGMVPPEDLLAASGMSPQYVMDYLSTKAGGGGGYGSGSGSRVTSPGAAEVAYRLSQMQQAGKTDTEMKYYLQSAIADGTITEGESEQLSANYYYKPNAAASSEAAGAARTGTPYTPTYSATTLGGEDLGTALKNKLSENGAANSAARNQATTSAGISTASSLASLFDPNRKK